MVWRIESCSPGICNMEDYALLVWKFHWVDLTSYFYLSSREEYFHHHVLSMLLSLLLDGRFCWFSGGGAHIYYLKECVRASEPLQVFSKCFMVLYDTNTVNKRLRLSITSTSLLTMEQVLCDTQPYYCLSRRLACLLYFWNHLAFLLVYFVAEWP